MRESSLWQALQSLTASLAFGYIVVDAVRLNHAFNAWIVQPKRSEFGFDRFFFCGRVNHKFGAANFAVAVCVKCRNDVAGVISIIEIRSFEIDQADGAFASIGIVIDPIEGCDQVVRRKQCVAVDVCAVEQNRFVTRDE